jgi:hypothetical protein
MKNENDINDINDTITFIDNVLDDEIATYPVDMSSTSYQDDDYVLIPVNTREDGKGDRIRYYCRFTRYIETGNRVYKFDGNTDIRPSVKLGFVIYYKDNNEELYKSKFDSTYHIYIHNGENSGFRKMYDEMTRNFGVRHLAQCLGHLYSIELKIVSGKNNKKYNSPLIDTLKAVCKYDPNTGLPITELSAIPSLKKDDLEEHIQVFFWNHPTKSHWDMIGKTRNGKFLQRDMMEALNYPGSKLQILLEGDIPKTIKEEAVSNKVEHNKPVMPKAPEVDFDDDIPF